MPAPRLSPDTAPYQVPTHVNLLSAGHGLELKPDGSWPDNQPTQAALLKRLQREPEEVLEDTVFAHYETTPSMQRPASKWEPPALRKQDVERARERWIKRGSAQLQPLAATTIAESLGVKPLDQLSECLSPYCSMTRLRQPVVREEGQRELVKFLRKTVPTRDSLVLAFVGTGGCFAETAVLAALHGAGFRRIEASFIERSLGPAISAAHGQQLAQLRKEGYQQGSLERQLGVLTQVANVLHPNFEQFTLRAFDSSANFVAAVAAGQANSVHASISIDPGLDGIFTVDVCWHATLVARYAGRPGATLAVAYADSGLGITRPEQAPIGDYQAYVTGHRNPAEFVGLDDDPCADAGLAEFQALQGPVVLWRSLHLSQFVGVRWELTQTMRAFSRYHVAAAVAGAVTAFVAGVYVGKP